MLLPPLYEPVPSRTCLHPADESKMWLSFGDTLRDLRICHIISIWGFVASWPQHCGGSMSRIAAAPDIQESLVDRPLFAWKSGLVIILIYVWPVFVLGSFLLGVIRDKSIITAAHQVWSGMENFVDALDSLMCAGTPSKPSMWQAMVLEAPPCAYIRQAGCRPAVQALFTNTLPGSVD